ncbi:MAG: hypothetical protein ABIQ51_05645 [Mesorhizobium sp.]
MRKLEGYEEIGLIGYPCDGEYIAVVGTGAHSWLLGGELCESPDAALARQATALRRYYPDSASLVLATIVGDELVSIRDYETASRQTSPEFDYARRSLEERK